MQMLKQIRAEAAARARSATHVRIRADAIASYAATLSLAQARAHGLDPHTHFVGERDATLAYIVQLDAINFGSGYFPHLAKRQGMSGYFTVASSLKDCFSALGPLSAEQLERLTQADCARIFGQLDADSVAQELMGLFARALNALGTYVVRGYDNSFSAMVEAANGSAERLASILAGMPFYRDTGFYKRAQLTAADLALAGVADFDDLDRLTIFADNLVPHVLRMDGILAYEPRLLERIDRGELIPAGSPEEIEIRACALHAVEEIVACLRQAAQPATSMQLDYLLWNRGQQPAYKAHPRHRTRTVFY